MDAFTAPSSIRAIQSTSVGRTETTTLFMNKKKSSSSKKTVKKPSSQGFGAAVSASDAAVKILGRNDPFYNFKFAGEVTPGIQSPQRVVSPDSGIVIPDYAADGIPKKGKGGPLLPWIIEVKTPEEIEKMRAAGKLARDVLDMAGRAVEVGITTDEIDVLVHEMIVEVRLYDTGLFSLSPTTFASHVG